jgi:hypothetical protein
MGVLDGKEEKRKTAQSLDSKGFDRKIKLWKTFLFEPIFRTQNRQNELKNSKQEEN